MKRKGEGEREGEIIETLSVNKKMQIDTVWFLKNRKITRGKEGREFKRRMRGREGEGEQAISKGDQANANRQLGANPNDSESLIKETKSRKKEKKIRLLFLNLRSNDTSNI